jgi:creatinine amidohydrolase
MRLEDLNWMQVEKYLEQDDRLLVVMGACEQHGYLSLATDVRIPLALAEAASQQSGVLVAPPLNFGISPYFASYPGTISLRSSTYLDVVEDMVRSVHNNGFRRLVFVNGHGGNDPARSRLIELANKLPGLHMAWYSWWIAPNVTLAAARHGLKSYHAAWIENFAFTRVGEVPNLEKEPPPPSGLSSAQEVRKIFGDGVFGGPYQASQVVMDEIFATALKDVLNLLNP